MLSLCVISIPIEEGSWKPMVPCVCVTVFNFVQDIFAIIFPLAFYLNTCLIFSTFDLSKKVPSIQTFSDQYFF